MYLQSMCTRIQCCNPLAQESGAQPTPIMEITQEIEDAGETALILPGGSSSGKDPGK